MKALIIFSLPELAHSAELAEAVEKLNAIFTSLEEFRNQTNEALEALCEKDEIESVSPTTTHWQWRAAGAPAPGATAQEVYRETGRISRALQRRDETRLAYYAAKLRTIACIEAVRPAIAKVKSLVLSTRAALGAIPLECAANLLHTELMMINAVLAEGLVSEVECRLASLSSQWVLCSQTFKNPDGSETVKPYPATEFLSPGAGQSIDMHGWLQKLYESFARRYFLHYGIRGETTKPVAPTSGLLTLLEAERAMYLFDLSSDYHYGTAELYQVRDGNIIAMDRRSVGCF